MKAIKKVLSSKILKDLNGKAITDMRFDELKEQGIFIPCSWETAKKIIHNKDYFPSKSKAEKMLSHYNVSYHYKNGVIKLGK